MKITVTAGKIATSLALVASAARPNQKKPALGLARITTSAGEISLAATDLHTAITATVAASVLEPGQVAIPHDKFSALISGFAGNVVLTVTATETDTMATITAGRSSYRLPMLGLDTLPEMPAIETATGEIEITTTDFLHLIGTVAAAETNQTRFYLCGCFLQSVGSNLNSVATDGTRLMQVGVEAASFSETRDCVIPTSAVAVICALLAKTKPKIITLRRSERLLAVTAPDFQFTTKLIDPGDKGFPETARVIPEPAPKPLRCSREGLLAVLRRLAAVATTDPTATLATLSGAEGRLSIILSRKPDDGRDDLVADGDLDRIVVSVRQLAGLLDQFDDPLIGLEAVNDIAPLVIRAENKFALVARAHWAGT